MHVRDVSGPWGKNGGTKLVKMKLSVIDVVLSEKQVGVVGLLCGLIF